MTNAELTSRYNELAQVLGLATLAPWKGKKAVLEARLSDLEETYRNHQEKAQKKKPVKAPSTKIIPELVDFLKAAVKESSVAEAIRNLVVAYPEATRINVKHSAAAAGINPLTARNTFDRINKENQQ